MQTCVDGIFQNRFYICKSGNAKPAWGYGYKYKCTNL